MSAQATSLHHVGAGTNDCRTGGLAYITIDGIAYDAQFVAQAVHGTSEQLLADLRRAWIRKQSAQATLTRLRAYSNRNAGMKDEAARAVRQLSEAEATIKRVLGGAA